MDMHLQTTSVHFSRAESDYYEDQAVQLNCADHGELIATLYATLSPYRPKGIVRPQEEPPPIPVSTLYEQDYQRVSRRLRTVTWEAFDLETAAFLFAYGGCLGRDEVAGMFPFALEILLRADAYVFPFLYYLRYLKSSVASDLSPILKNEKSREIVATALTALRDKFLGSRLSDAHRYKLEELFGDVADWTSLTDWP